MPLEEMKLLDPQPFLDEIWGAFIPEGSKPPSLAKFDGRNDIYEHAAFINTQMTVMGVFGSLICKLLSGTFGDATL